MNAKVRRYVARGWPHLSPDDADQVATAIERTLELEEFVSLYGEYSLRDGVLHRSRALVLLNKANRRLNAVMERLKLTAALRNQQRNKHAAISTCH